MYIVEQIIQNSPYFLHKVKLWFDSSCRGEGKGVYIYVNGKHYVVEDYDEQKKYIHTKTNQEKTIIKLGDLEPNIDLFMDIIGRNWTLVHKEVWIDNARRDLHVPCYYQTIDDYIENRGELYNPYHH